MDRERVGGGVGTGRRRPAAGEDCLPRPMHFLKPVTVVCVCVCVRARAPAMWRGL